MIKPWMYKKSGHPLAGWSYRKSITLSRASGAVTNYQMKLLVYESELASSVQVSGCENTTGWSYFNANLSNVAGIEGTNCLKIAGIGTDAYGVYNLPSNKDWSATRYIKFWHRRDGSEQTNGQCFIYSGAAWVTWNFTMTTIWTEQLIDTNNPDASSGVMDWTNIRAIRFDANSNGTNLYIDDIKRGSANNSNNHNANFDDLRFTTSDGTTLLDYWIESILGSTPNQLATVWIEFDSIGTSATTFYMYYGNSGASAQYATSSLAGKATFPFFDHFIDDPPASADWYHWFDNGSETVSNSIFTVTGHVSYNAWGCKQKFGTNYAYRGLVRDANDGATGTDVTAFGIDDRSANGSYTGTGVDQARFSCGTAKYWVTGSEGTATNDARTDVISAWNVLEIRRNASTNVSFAINDTVKKTITTNIPTDNCGLIISTDHASNIIDWDWVLVRQFLATEPAWGSWGTQESVYL